MHTKTSLVGRVSRPLRLTSLYHKSYELFENHQARAGAKNRHATVIHTKGTLRGGPTRGFVAKAP